jgi:hypothetical protein
MVDSKNTVEFLSLFMKNSYTMYNMKDVHQSPHLCLHLRDDKGRQGRGWLDWVLMLDSLMSIVYVIKHQHTIFCGRYAPPNVTGYHSLVLISQNKLEKSFQPHTHKTDRQTYALMQFKVMEMFITRKAWVMNDGNWAGSKDMASLH